MKIVPFTFALHFGALEGLISYSLVTIECGVAKDRNDERNLQRFVAAVSVAAVSAFLTLSPCALLSCHLTQTEVFALVISLPGCLLRHSDGSRAHLPLPELHM